MLVPGIFSLFNLQLKDIHVFKFSLVIVFCHIAIFAVVYLSTNLGATFHRNNNPSYSLALSAQSYWDKYNRDKPLKYVSGNPPIDYYLGAYLASKPNYISDLSFKKSPWVNKDMAKKFGILVVFNDCSDKNKTSLQRKSFIIRHQACRTVVISNKFSRQTKAYGFFIVSVK